MSYLIYRLDIHDRSILGHDEASTGFSDIHRVHRLARPEVDGDERVAPQITYACSPLGPSTTPLIGGAVEVPASGQW
jgi:hypothetical protein